jgi:hypothetical protein
MAATVIRPLLVRTAILALAGMLAAVLVGGIVSSGANDGSTLAASTPNVKILGQKFLKQAASGGTGTKNVLLKIGKLHHRAVCKDLGAGAIGLEIQMRSRQAGAVAVRGNQSGPVPNNYVEFFEYSDPSGLVATEYDVIYPGGKTRHFHLVFGAKILGADCVARLVATND